MRDHRIRPDGDVIADFHVSNDFDTRTDVNAISDCRRSYTPTAIGTSDSDALRQIDIVSQNGIDTDNQTSGMPYV